MRIEPLDATKKLRQRSAPRPGPPSARWWFPWRCPASLRAAHGDDGVARRIQYFLDAADARHEDPSGGLADSYASLRLEIGSAYTFLFFVILVPLLSLMQSLPEWLAKRRAEKRLKAAQAAEDEALQ